MWCNIMHIDAMRNNKKEDPTKTTVVKTTTTRVAIIFLAIITVHSEKMLHWWAHKSKLLTTADEKMGLPHHFDSVSHIHSTH